MSWNELEETKRAPLKFSAFAAPPFTRCWRSWMITRAPPLQNLQPLPLPVPDHRLSVTSAPVWLHLVLTGGVDIRQTEFRLATFHAISSVVLRFVQSAICLVQQLFRTFRSRHCGDHSNADSQCSVSDRLEPSLGDGIADVFRSGAHRSQVTARNHQQELFTAIAPGTVVIPDLGRQQFT